MEKFVSGHLQGKDRGNSLINRKMIFRVLGVLLLIEGMMFLVCTSVSLSYGEDDYRYFLYTFLLNSGIGGTMMLYGRKAKNKLNRRDGYCIVTLAWVLFTLFGLLPFYLSGSIPTVTDAFFETMSGFTTTGASILNNIESLSHGMLFWRSLTQWIGGLGIVFFTIAILPIFTSGGIQLFSAESTGVTHDKIHPKTNIMAKRLWTIYLVLTVAETLLLLCGGMNLFDAVCQSFATTATGGYSTKQASIAYWNSPYIEYVVATFMILSGVNFSLYFLFVKGRVKKLFKDEELRWFLGSVTVLTAIITTALIVQNQYDVELAFRKALFQVATAHTTCGFVTDDYNLWPSFTWLLLLFAMVAGASTGSTSGGVKSMRLLIVARSIRNEFKHILHPNAVLPVRVNQQAVSPSILIMVSAFFLFYIACIFIGWTVLLFLGVGFSEGLGTVISSLGGVGPGLGAFGPAFSWAALPDAAKWVLSFLMLIGRLELFCVLLLFYPGFWKNR
ncbi:MAG: TrkH family potassium uptake protein [Bacteroides sp.]